ncbi:MAG: hypothetical protein CMO05_02105, partial [Thalassospira sp.]|nr:hypothetical protein [Thalassospira sp.]
MGPESYIGSVSCTAGNFAPRDTVLCLGQTIGISNYASLYSIIGDTFGGDGRITFCLPDMRGRTAVGVGQGPTLDNVIRGEKRGAESAIVPVPKHNHDAEVGVVSPAYPVTGSINTPIGLLSGNANLNISSSTLSGTASVSGTAPVSGTTPVTLNGYVGVNTTNGSSPVPQMNGSLAKATVGGNPVSMFDTGPTPGDVSGGWVTVSGDIPATGKTVDGSGFSIDTSGLTVSVAGYAETNGLAVDIPPSVFNLSAIVPEGNFRAFVHDSGEPEATVETIPPQ